MLIKLRALAQSIGALSLAVVLAAFALSGLSKAAAGEGDVFAPQNDPVAFDLFQFPELLVNGYRQETVKAGKVGSIKALGFHPADAVQNDPDMQPTYNDRQAGVQFAAGSREHLDFGHVNDALRSYRWVLLTLKLDQSAEPDGRSSILSVNEDDLAGGRVPRIEYAANFGLTVEWRGQGPTGSKSYKLTSQDVIADGETWNVVLVYRRHGRLFLDVNGQTSPTDSETLSFSAPPSREDTSSFIGDPLGNTFGWAFDTIVFGQTELSEAMAEKIVGWAAARVGSTDLLSENHPYRSYPPLHNAKIVASQYTHDPDAWSSAWVTIPKKNRVLYLGNPMPATEGFERVFLDDFRADSVARSDASEGGETAIWFAPGWNRGVGKDAQLRALNGSSELYEHDPDVQTLTLSIGFENRWQGSAIYSVNDAGLGRSWEGGGIFRTRAKFPALDENPDVGYFPAVLWFYNLEHLFWRTSERIEIDGFEFEGNDDRWINGGSAHVHAGEYPGKFGHLERDIRHEKVLGARLDIDIWDGEFHLWELRIDPDLTYLGLDGRELARVKTPVEFLQRIYLIADYALRLEYGEPDRDARHDMVLDYVEVLQRTDKLDELPKGFLTRPVMNGDLTIGKILQCGAELDSDTADIWYFWYSDGYPRGFSPSSEYKVTTLDAGTHLRCMMKLVGLVEQPEAWSKPMAVAEF
ncbi:MAG: hypothetical protein AAGA97_00635 [Pseudomonadota bacterium]